ncbi:MAG: hypothetical protein ACK4SN_02815 [Bellilinea sp.]
MFGLFKNKKPAEQQKDSGVIRTHETGSCGTDCHCLVLLAKAGGFVSGSGWHQPRLRHTQGIILQLRIFINFILIIALDYITGKNFVKAFVEK